MTFIILLFFKLFLLNNLTNAVTIEREYAKECVEAYVDRIVHHCIYPGKSTVCYNFSKLKESNINKKSNNLGKF